ncbi:methyltransferase domain-containing protein [Aeoliella sp. SH292]|uniref:methyltransferase domain-containing protein n=1 Tax=Aeoliella sp. SH292 TaxID=3454464 RepID=UPI003F9E3C4C
MQRELEPEVMDTPDEAVAYDQMDHSGVNRRFVDDLLAAWGSIEGTVEVVDLGTGTALIPIELCRRDARVHVVAVDAAEHMLEVARANIARAGLADRIRLELADAKQQSAGAYDVVMSNSLVHHLSEPAMFFDRAVELLRPRGMLFVRDLFRAASEAEWHRLVDLYTVGESEHARQMFAESLRAALTVDEVRELVAARGFDSASVTATSDRHWTWVARAN